MFLPAHFSRFYQEITPNRDRRQKIQRAVKRIQEVVNDDGPLNDLALAPLVPQGSFEAGTLVRPLGSKPDYDIDFIFPIDFELFPNGWFDNRRTPQYILGYVQRRIAQYYDTRVEGRGKCIRIKYQDGFHIDLVPGHPIQSGAFQIADQEEDEFVNTDPQAMLGWIDEIEAASGGRFRRAVTMLKRWRDENFSKAMGPSGLHLTLLAGIAWQDYCQDETDEFTVLSSENSAMDAFMWDIGNAMLQALRDTNCSISLPMPGIVGEDLGRTWDTERQKRLATVLETYTKRAGEAINTKRADVAADRWRSVFGAAFITNP